MIQFFDKLKSPYILRMGYAVIGSSFKYAKSINLVHSNMAIAAIKAKRGKIKKEKRNGKINTTSIKRPVLNSEQMYKLARSIFPVKRYGFYFGLDIGGNPNVWISSAIHIAR